MFKHNLTALLNMQRKDKHGCYALRLRTTINRKITYYPTGIAIKPAQWDQDKKEIINHPHKTQLNALLRKKWNDLETEILNAALNGKTLAKPKKQNTNFITFCEAKIKEQQRTDKWATTKHKKTDLNILRGFRPKIAFEDITVHFLHQFEDYCKKELGNIHNTIWGHMKFVKGMIRQAVNEDLIDAKILTDYKMPKYIDPERDYLVLDEVDKIEKFRNETDNPTLRNVCDWFLFACYSGLRYADVKAFTMDQVKMGKIILRTSKKGIDTTLAIHPRLQKVMDRMPAGVFTNQRCNLYLKIIAAGAGINKEITFHVARHSFAVIFLELGGTMEELQKFLGHTKIGTTSVYGKITNKRLDNAIKRTWG